MDLEITPQSDDFMVIQALTVAPAVAKKFKLVISNISLQVKTVIFGIRNFLIANFRSI